MTSIIHAIKLLATWIEPSRPRRDAETCLITKRSNRTAEGIVSFSDGTFWGTLSYSQACDPNRQQALLDQTESSGELPNETPAKEHLYKTSHFTPFAATHHYEHVALSLRERKAPAGLPSSRGARGLRTPIGAHPSQPSHSKTIPIYAEQNDKSQAGAPSSSYSTCRQSVMISREVSILTACCRRLRCYSSHHEKQRTTQTGHPADIEKTETLHGVMSRYKPLEIRSSPFQSKLMVES